MELGQWVWGRIIENSYICKDKSLDLYATALKVEKINWATTIILILLPSFLIDKRSPTNKKIMYNWGIQGCNFVTGIILMQSNFNYGVILTTVRK